MKTTEERRSSLWVVGAILLVVCVACATAPEPAPEAPKPTTQVPPPQSKVPQGVPAAAPKEAVPPETFFTHTIKWSGESLSIIAAWYTGDLQNWKALAEANPEINPNRVYEGLKIRIPERLMTTKAPMTKEHVDSFYSASKKPSRRGTDTPQKDEEPKLFGPKDIPKK